MEKEEYLSVARFSLIVRALSARPERTKIMVVRILNRSLGLLWFNLAIYNPKELRCIKAQFSWDELQEMLSCINATDEDLELVNTMSDENNLIFI